MKIENIMNNLFKVVFVCSFILGFDSMAQKTIKSEETKTISNSEIKAEAPNKSIQIKSDGQNEPVDSEDEDGKEIYLDGMENNRSKGRIEKTPYTVTTNNDDLERAYAKLTEWKGFLDKGTMSKADFDNLTMLLKRNIRGTAITKLNMAKELLDAGKISKVHFDNVKKSLEKFLFN